MTKRSGQWFGDSVLQIVTAGGGVSNVIQLLPTADSLQSMRDIVFERSILSIQTRRILPSVLEGLAYIVWKGEVLSGTSTPTEGMDALSTSDFSWAHGRIMHYGPLHVPPNISDGSTGTIVVNQEVTAEQVEIVVKRKVNRANEGIFMRISADVSNVVKCNITWRTYYTYS